MMVNVPMTVSFLIGWTIPFMLTLLMNIIYILTVTINALKKCTARCPGVWIGLGWAITASNNFLMMSALYGRPGGGPLIEGMIFNSANGATVTALDILFPLSSTLFYMIYVKKMSLFY